MHGAFFALLTSRSLLDSVVVRQSLHVSRRLLLRRPAPTSRFCRSADARDAEAYCLTQLASAKVEAFWGRHGRKPSGYTSTRLTDIEGAGPGLFATAVYRDAAARVQSQNSALPHEIVHVYATKRHRFLAEGLAVYLHQKLAGNAPSRTLAGISTPRREGGCRGSNLRAAERCARPLHWARSGRARRIRSCRLVRRLSDRKIACRISQSLRNRRL